MATKPIKRNEHIVILSREHHSGLLFCWKIRTGLKMDVNAERIVRYVIFWENYLQKHFNEEEEHLFFKVKDDECKKGLAQHEKIKLLIKRINSDTAKLNPGILTQLADYVDNHIRFEERELFPHLENILDEQELIRIGAALEH